MEEHSLVKDADRVPNVPVAYQRKVVPFLHLNARGVFLVVVTLGLAVLPLVLLRLQVGATSYILHVLMYMFMYIAMTSSWNIIGGYAGYVSFGHNVFFTLGAYLSGVLLVYWGISPFITAPISGLVAVGFGLLVGLITLRTRGPAFVLSTIVLSMLVRLGLDNWKFVGGANGLSLPLLDIPYRWAKVPFYYGMFVFAVLAVLLSYRVWHSKFGLGLRAISQDEVKAEVAGINTAFYKILAFGLSAFFPAAVGALWGYQLSYLRPTAFLDIGISVNMILMARLGGSRTIAGPIVGVILLTLLNELAVWRLGSTELNIAITGLLLMIIVLFFPDGILGTLKERGRLPRLLQWE